MSTLESVRAVPRVLLPAGTTTSARPRIEWKWEAYAEAWEVRIREVNCQGDDSCVIWQSSTLPGASHHTHPDADLPSHSSLCAEVRARQNGAWTPWGTASIFRIEPICPLHEGIVVYDLHYTRELSPLQAFAHAHLVSALQGLVNRHRPQLYIRFVQTDRNLGSGQVDLDQFWLDRLKSDDGWIGESLIRTVSSLPDLLELFGDAYRGLVVWDPAVPATSNVASTIAGADHLLPVPFCCDASGLYRDLIIDLRIPVETDLRGKFTGTGCIPGTGRESTGSPKCDAYLWAMENYIQTGKCDPCYMGHYIDAWWTRNPAAGGNIQNHTLTNHDYFISRRGFFWDLNVWPDEVPIDDPEQRSGTDAATLREVLLKANALTKNHEMIHVGGFTPWSFKYTNHHGAGGQHDPVSTEWELVRVLSSYNAYIDADALGLSALANASFLCHFPLPQTYAPVLANTPAELKDVGLLDDENQPAQRDFVLNYVGDYDSAAWTWSALSQLWESPARTKVTQAWAINPNLVERVAPMFEYLYRTRSASDHFMTGDSGAGYINPTQMLAPREPSLLPDASSVWQNHCLKWYRRFGIRFTGFLINGNAGPMTPAAERMYLAFSPDGIVNHHRPGGDNYRAVADKMPVFDMLSDIDDLESGIAIICKKAGECGEKPRFLVFRQILKSPQYYLDLQTALKAKGTGLAPVFCDPHTFSALARAKLGISNDDQYSLLFNAIPGKARAGDVVTGDVGMRNDGWNTWTPAEHTLRIEVISYGGGDVIWQKMVPLQTEVKPGEAVVWSIELPTPDFPGEYLLHLDLCRNGVPFSATAGFAVEMRIKVKRADVAATL